MTKHLRFLIVLLMTLVWSTGGAQTTIWSEDWTGKANDTQPKNMKYDNVVYSNSYSSTKIFNETRAGGSAPELLLSGKTNAKDTWIVTINDLKGCYGEFTLSLYTNNNSLTSVNVNGANVSLSDFKEKGVDRTATFTVNEGTSSLKLEFTTSSSNNTRIDNIVLTAASASESKTATKVSFGLNSNKTFTFTEGKLEGFTTPTATETNNVAGTIKYSSNNESAVSVNPSTGELSFPGYGEATITATFTPTDAKTYAVSTDSYKVKNEAKKSDNILTFSGELKSFDNVREYEKTLSEANVTLNGSDGKTYIFISNGGKNGSARFLLPTKTGKLQSPTFPSYINGYNVVITYGIGGTGYPSVTANGKKVTGTVKGDYNKGTGATLSLDVTDGSAFTVTSGTNALAISKIEITPNKVDETESITLNESATNNNIVAKAGVNVTLKRTMAKGVWNTICLPFDVTYDVAQAAFGNDVKIAELDKTSTGTILSFKNVDVIKAAKPYLIKPSTAYPAEGYVFKNVTIASDKIEPEEVATDDYSSFGFVGIYNKTDIYTGIDKTIFSGEFYAAFLGANNTVYKANPVKEPGKETKGFRAYFAIPNGVKAPELRVVIDGTATSIKSINSEVVESNAPVYNLQGQRVDGNNLTPGIYVKAGKKFVVK